MSNGPLESSSPSLDELAALRAIVEGTARSTGDEFFVTLVRHLASALGVQHSMVAEFVTPSRVRALAYWQVDRHVPDLEYDLAGTPCEEVASGKLCHYPDSVARKFPADIPLTKMRIESYLGVPLVASDGHNLGHLCVFDSKPMPEEPRNLLIFRIFAARAVAELARLRLEKNLADSEQRYRDLYEEAPIAYVHEDLESRFISANRAAMRILGITPEEVPGTIGLSFIPDTPERTKKI